MLRDISERRGEPKTLLHAPKTAKLAAADRDLMTELTYGVLRWRNRLDFILSHHSKRALERIDDVALTALRLGVYQLKFLSRVPTHAAVDESVRLVRHFGAPRAVPFVNAVLRNIVRQPEAPRLPSAEEDPLRYLETTLSHPGWLARRYLDRLGFEAAKARCLAQNEPPPLHVRVSLRAGPMEHTIETLSTEGVAASAIPSAPRALLVTGGALRQTTLYRAGHLYIQDAGSQLVADLIAPSGDERVVDVCSAPGGKALAIADRLPNGKIVALDRRTKRAALVRSLSAKHGADNVMVAVADGRALPLRGTFGHILLDAPCSSSGTLRRNPDIKWRLSPESFTKHSELQLALLEAASSHLAPGGKLVYATCSSEPEENEGVIDAFLARRSEFRALAVEGAFARADGAFETRPEREPMDGYFARVLTRI